MLETSWAWCTVICGQKSLVKMLLFSEVDCFLWGAELHCQAVKETKTCRLSLPIASFHRLPETNTVRRADLVLGLSPWFPRFAWLSRRQQAPHPTPTLPTPPPAPKCVSSPFSTHPLIHAASQLHLSLCVLEDYVTTGSSSPTHSPSLINILCLHECCSFNNSVMIRLMHSL